MAADWAVAAGTGALALATFWLAWHARKEAATVAEQVAASERPIVYPITPHTWYETNGDGGKLLAFRNGGSGIARNVHGRVWWDADGMTAEAPLVGQTLGAQDYSRLRVGDGMTIRRWSRVQGYVTYSDIREVEWRSDFRYGETSGLVWAELVRWAPSRELEDYRPPHFETPMLPRAPAPP